MVNQIPAPRQEFRFKSWLAARGLTYHWVAQVSNGEITLGRANQIVNQGRATPAQLDIFRQVGVPEEALPLPSRAKAGPVKGELARLRAIAAQYEEAQHAAEAAPPSMVAA